MRLTVLGNPGNYLAPYSGGSSYLLEHEGARVLLDCGGGAREALSRLRLSEPLDAIVISHFHFDHCMDLPTLRAALGEGTTFYIPKGERGRMDALAEAYVFRGGRTLAEAMREGVPPAKFDVPGDVVEVDAETRAVAGGLRLGFAPTQHSAPSFATRIESDEAAFVYASDTAACDGLRGLARDADLLLMHTLLPTVDPESDHAKVHATAQTAAALANDTGARRLLLSHRYWESGDAAMVEAASGHKHVELARERGTYDIK